MRPPFVPGLYLRVSCRARLLTEVRAWLALAIAGGGERSWLLKYAAVHVDRRLLPCVDSRLLCLCDVHTRNGFRGDLASMTPRWCVCVDDAQAPLLFRLTRHTRTRLLRQDGRHGRSWHRRWGRGLGLGRGAARVCGPQGVDGPLLPVRVSVRACIRMCSVRLWRGEAQHTHPT